MARFTAKCSVNGGTGESGAMSAVNRLGFELRLYSMIERTGKGGEGIQGPFYIGRLCVMQDT
jgi:hypothetical protein